MRKFFFLVLFIALCFKISGQQASKLLGQIINSKTLEGVPYATVGVLSNNTGVVSDAKGFFTILVPSDTSTLVISCLGFRMKKEKLNPDKLLHFYYIKLSEELKELSEITIIAEKDRIARISSEISSVKMSPALVAKLPNMGEVDILRSFQLLPGVSATNETSAGLYVRGGTPDQNLILFDGMTIYNVDHFYGFFSAFNANAIDDIELIKGGFPAAYGGRTSSVMVITGKPANFRKVSGTASLSLLSLNGAIDIPLITDKLSLQVAVRRSYTDLIRTKLYDKIFNMYSDNSTTSTSVQGPGGFGGGFGRMQTVTQQPKFYFYDLNTKLTWKPNEKNDVALSFYNGKDNLDNSRDMSMAFGFSGSGTTGTTEERKDIAGWGNTGISGQWHTQLFPFLKSSVFISYSDYFSNRDIKNISADSDNETTMRPNTNTYEDNNVRDVSFRIKNELILAEWNTIEFGFENTINEISYKLRFNDTLEINNSSQHGFQSALYLQDRILFFNKKLDLNAGFRTTYYNITDKIYFEPRLSAAYKVNDRLRLKASSGYYNQFITRIIREDILQGSKDFWLMADDSTISVSSAAHFISGINYEKGSYMLDVEAFYKKLYGLTEYSSRSTTIGRRDGVNRQDQFFKGEGHVKGVELMIQKKYGLNTGWVAYTLSEVKYTFPGLNYGKPYYALHNQKHEFKTVYTRKLGNWDLSATFVYASGKAYTAPVSQYELTLLDGSVYSYIHVSDKNSLRLPAYHKMDVSGSYTWKGRNTDITLSMSVFNLYNHKNIWYREFDIQENEMSVTDVTYLGITPNVSFTVRFK
jgi:ferric enterobactin receptor